MTRRKLLVSVLGVLGSVAVALGAARLTNSTAGRSDCPGKIVCPLTGELVCKDRCPLDADKAGQQDADSLPACCRAKK